MQFILTEEEYNNLKKENKEELARMRKVVNTLCMDVARYKPTFKGWSGAEEPHPWGCHHIDYSDGKNPPSAYSDDACYGYCDECPVQHACTLSKEYSQ